MKPRALILFATFVLVAADKPAKESKMKDAEKLKGTWNFASLEIDGRQLPAEAVRKSKIEIKGKEFTTTSAGAVYKGTFTIDASKTPKTLDLYFTEGPEKGNTCLAIYELDGDTWKLCLCVSSKERPKEFATKAGSGHALEVLKRSKP